jgi:radical SAM superfamily enzyme YgiQ (UPF0313 family)
VLELPVNTGRGCVGRCKFCARVTGGVMRRRSVDNIISEVRHNVERYGCGAIVFMDESFAQDRELARAVSRGMIAAGLHQKLYWLCQTRVDSVDHDTLSLMAEAGCRYIAFGVESGNPEILAQAGKRITKDRVRQAVREAHNVGIQVDNFFILGLPGDTEATIHETIRFALELDSDFVNFFLLVPYPGTEVYEMARRGDNGLNLLTKDWDMYGIQMGRALELATVPRARLELLQFEAYLRFYLRPRRLRSLMRMVKPKVLPVYLWHLIAGQIQRRFGRREIQCL